MQKKAFSLIELIFMIVVMGIIASVALPKLLNTKNNAVVSSLKQDISTITTSVQSYYLVNGKIDRISDAVNLNNSTWEITDKEIKYIENNNDCVTIKITNDNKLIVTIDSVAGNICQALSDNGIETISYNLQ